MRIVGALRRVKIDRGGEGSGNFDHAGRPGEVGGSAPRGVRGVLETDTLPPRKMKQIYDWERRHRTGELDFRGNPVFESGFMLGLHEGGRWHIKNWAKPVSPNRCGWGSDAILESQTEGATTVVTHTHPTEDITFSAEDFAFLYRSNGEEIRAACETSTYFIRLTPEFTDQEQPVGEAKRFAETVNYYIQLRNDLVINSRSESDALLAQGMTNREVFYELGMNDSMHEFWQETADKFPDVILDYRREEL